MDFMNRSIEQKEMSILFAQQINPKVCYNFYSILLEKRLLHSIKKINLRLKFN